MAAVEFAEVNEVILTCGVLHKIAFLDGLVAEALALDQVWVDVCGETDSLLPELTDPFVKAGIHIGIPLPVPEDAFSE